MPDLNSLMIFAHVVEANSFSKAARLLKMPSSTESRKIAELEHDLGVRLIERSTRSLRVTDAGSEVLEHTQRSAEINDAIANIASNVLEANRACCSITSELTLNMPCKASSNILARSRPSYGAASCTASLPVQPFFWKTLLK